MKDMTVWDFLLRFKQYVMILQLKGDAIFDLRCLLQPADAQFRGNFVGFLFLLLRVEETK